MSKNMKRLVLEISNLPCEIEPELLQKAAEEVLNRYPVSTIKPPLIMVHFVDPSTMQELNNHYRSVNNSTDVLSFSLMSDYQHNDHEYCLLGEIYLDWNYIKSNITAEKHSLVEEALFIFIHGCLHLLGHTHETDEKQETMLELQKIILGAVHEKL